MSLLQMSLSGAVLIIVIVIIRAAAIYKFPKKTFLALWTLAILRLLVPFSVPSMFSVYTFIRNNMSMRIFSEAKTRNIIPAIQQGNPFAATQGASQSAPNTLLSAHLWSVVWLIGIMLFAAFFVVSYLRCLKEFQTALPANNDYTNQWLEKHVLKRSLSIKQSDRISAPLTYGIFHPVILMPKNTNWEDVEQLQYILSHEYVHICRFDAITKLIMTATVCIHWFNPMVWVMYLLFNRDIELACDESVVRQFGEKSKSAYAKALIDMTARQSGLFPFSNSFSKNAIEERIKSIMKTKKATMGLTVGSIALILVVVALFVTSTRNKQMVFVSGNLYISTEQDVSEMVLHEAEISEYDSAYIGVIESTVSRSKEPTTELQSNFGNIGSEIVFNGNGIAINLNEKWIQFEAQDVITLPPSTLTQLSKSISYNNGSIQFTIPDSDDIWNIQIYGLIDIDGNSGMSVHYLTDENENNSWERGKTYSFDVSSGGYTELYLDATNSLGTLSVDIMELLP
ncbi:MAG: M56 family metallopeptidase [Clostridiales bacterium]|nr:M56 family metallopeptidase [Clostridiales bacterium]